MPNLSSKSALDKARASLWEALAGCAYYLYNAFITNVPFYWVRHLFLKKVFGIKIGAGSSIGMGCFISGRRIQIGNNSIINRDVYLDGRTGLKIGNNVSISFGCAILSLTHDPHDDDFRAIGKPVEIGDYAWIGIKSIIVPGIKVGQNAIVAAGAVVTKDIPPSSIAGGIPAKLIGTRNANPKYKLGYFPFAYSESNYD